MNQALALELFGYLGSFLVLISMVMTSVVRLRVINLIGSAVFATYAILIRSYPTALLNACLVGVNVYHLMKLRQTTGRFYELQQLGAGEGLTDWFIRRYGKDMAKYFPEVDEEKLGKAEGYAVFYADQAAGLLLGEKKGSCFEVLLDYSAPAFRDCSVGGFLYEQLPAFGIERLTCAAGSPEHTQYLEKMGFTRQDDGSCVKEL